MDVPTSSSSSTNSAWIPPPTIQAPPPGGRTTPEFWATPPVSSEAGYIAPPPYPPYPPPGWLAGQPGPPFWAGQLRYWGLSGQVQGPGNPGPGSGLSRESSRDDLTSVGLGDQIFDYEDRFRVDRRKLELLMIGRFDPITESATDFFMRIGDETSTTVIWPSRLKIGAKSKKDPHIRVGGQEEGVRKAKALIMEYLDTKTNRVTMKMDVSYTDHSHVIGKGGNTIRRVMAETSCHIHFPDSNRSNPNEKSNQVSIAGEMEGVEKARARVRELTPLIFTFDLPLIPTFDSAPDPNDPYLRAIQDQYNIQVMFRQKQKNFHNTMAVVKGCEREACRVKEATLLLVDHMCGGVPGTPTTPLGGPLGSSSQTIPVSMNMEISPVHHPIVLGKNNINLKIIMQRTKTTILFPDASDPNIPPIRKGSVTITGAIHNVYLARQQLIGSLPLVMMFDLPDCFDIDDHIVQKMQEELSVAVSIKPKQRQSNKSVLIKAQERDASGIYAARHRLLGLDDDDPPIIADIPETYKLQTGPAHLLPGPTLPVHHRRGSTSNLLMAPPTLGPFGTTNMMYNNYGGHSPHQPFFGSHGGVVPPPNSPYAPPLSPWAGAANLPQSPLANLTGFGNVLTPNHPYLQDYAWLVLNNITRMQQQQQQQAEEQQHQQQQVRNKIDPDGNNNYIEETKTPITSSSHNFLHADGGTDNSPPVNGSSPRNSSPVHDDGNLTNNLSKLDLNQTDKLLHNEHISSSSGLGTSNTSGDMSNNSSNSINKNRELGQLFMDKLVDRRAPGCEMKSLQLAVQKQLDYDQKKLLATKAMQTKPTGEPRTPTPTWSGLGFSSSMPENVIRDKLAAEEAAAKSQQNMVRRSLLGVDEEDGEEEATGEDNEGREEAKNDSSFPYVGGNAWFGNSSAFDALLHPPKSLAMTNQSILPSDDLPSLFAKHGLAKYTDLFVRHEVDLSTFASLTEQDLKEIGVQTFGARKKLLLLANKVKQAFNQKW